MSRTSLRLADDGLAILTLERADARNAIDPQMVESLARATKAAAAHRDARALLIRAEGPAFSVGGDLRHLGARADNLEDELEAMVSLYTSRCTASPSSQCRSFAPRRARSPAARSGCCGSPMSRSSQRTQSSPPASWRSD